MSLGYSSLCKIEFDHLRLRFNADNLILMCKIVVTNYVYYHYKNTPMQYTEIFLVVKIKIFTGKKMIFFLFLLQT